MDCEKVQNLQSALSQQSEGDSSLVILFNCNAARLSYKSFPVELIIDI
ncbi:hypothetical protein EMIT0P44_450018 [Pseudomonas sp. IT-P44]